MKIRFLIGSKRLQIYPQLPEELLSEVRKAVRYRIFNYQHTNAYKNFNWDGYKVPLWKNQTAPSGLCGRLRGTLIKLGHEVEIVFHNDYDPKGEIFVHNIKLYDFQEKAIKNAVKSRNCIIDAPIRSGKTAIIAGIINRIGHFPAWVITSASQGGKDAVRQTQRELKRYLEMPVGIFSEGKFNEEKIVVTSYEAIKQILRLDPGERSGKIIERNKKILKIVRKTKVLLLDECHHAFSDKSQEIIDEFRMAGYKIGLSGTPKPDKKTKIEMECGIGKIAFKCSFKTLIEKGRLATPLVILYNLPYAWYTANFTEYPDVYWSHIVENEFRNRFIADVTKNLNKRGKLVYILVRRKEHGFNLRKCIPGSVYIFGDVPTETRESFYKSLQHGKLRCIISTVGKEVLNLPKLDAVINAEGLSGKVVTTQKMRSLTFHERKKHGIVVDFIDKGKYLMDHSESRSSQYKKHKGFIVKDKKVPRDYFPLEDL